VVCLVGGIGVTPALAMCRALARSPRPFRLHVDYSARTLAQAVCLDELLAYPERNPNLRVTARLTRRDGRLTCEQVRQLEQEYRSPDFYLCGSPSYVEAAGGYLRECGVPEERIRIEVFTPAGAPPLAAAPREPAVCPVAHAEASAAPPSPLEEGAALLRAFYQESGAPDAFPERWAQVRDEMERTGTYTQTTDEVAHAARVAWRNSTRCIGRLYWQGRSVPDF